MPIVSSSYLIPATLPGGARRVIYTHVDHVGEEHVFRSIVGKDDNIDDYMAAQVVQMNERLGVVEKRRVEQFVEDGGDPSGFTLNHTTRAEVLRYIVRAFLRMEPHKAIVAAKWLQANATATQIEAATSTQVKDRVVARAQRLIAMENDLAADELDRGEFK